MGQEKPYGLINNAAIATIGDKITWIGRTKTLPRGYASNAKEVIDAEGGLITPGLIDCHTHLIYAGSRAKEFEMRLMGVSYEEIARKGGGILSTVFATRSADEDTLFRQSAPRVLSLMREGVTTVEIKSGYGLDLETEARILKVAARLGNEFPITVVRTYLGAHALPPEYHGKSDEYIDYVCNNILPHVAQHGLAQFVDVFCEKIAFSTQQTEKVFKVARKHGLKIKLHAEQLSNQGGAQLAAHYAAVSVDHLEYLDEEGIKALAESGTVAVLLPGAAYFLKEEKKPPVDLLRQYGVPMAVSTDCNPGSSPVVSLLLMMNMACVHFGLTPEEALRGVTINAAKALALEDRVGTLERGKVADMVLWDVSEPAELSYNIGLNPCRLVIREGKIIPRNRLHPFPGPE
ncbi:MAG: imidazolonepropionase [Deltaproteobacteria bacterium]|nr:imidazolonepropionase [Deltaproteobacteria bacterium]MBW2082398.1 imidazolonepropionase [Deltaproteobacteria bacterium]